MTSSASPLPRPGTAEPVWLKEAYVHLRDVGTASIVEAGEGFWASLAQRPELQAGRLVGTFRMLEDMPHWEMHPAGDELLVALSGEFELVMQDDRGHRQVDLRAGQAAVVPFGTWHRLLVQEEGEILFVTSCRGTEHRSL